MLPSLRLPMLACTLLLGACSPTTPLFIAQITTNEVVEYKNMKEQRMQAAIEEEGDLLTYSAKAIRGAKSEQAEQLYLKGYNDKRLSDDVRAIALYQIGLIYMNRFNDQRNDSLALSYFKKMLHEFPASRAAQRAEIRIEIIHERASALVQKSSRELLSNWQPTQQLDLHRPSFDQDMTLLSRRAVLHNRVDEAAELYTLALSDPAIPAEIKAKALYQLGLMNLSVENPQPDREKAIAYFRRLLTEFPDSDLNEKTARHLDQALNR